MGQEFIGSYYVEKYEHLGERSYTIWEVLDYVGRDHLLCGESWRFKPCAGVSEKMEYWKGTIFPILGVLAMCIQWGVFRSVKAALADIEIAEEVKSMDKPSSWESKARDQGEESCLSQSTG